MLAQALMAVVPAEDALEVEAMGSFMHRRDDWIVIDDPVGPGKPCADALNLFGQG